MKGFDAHDRERRRKLGQLRILGAQVHLTKISFHGQEIESGIFKFCIPPPPQIINTLLHFYRLTPLNSCLPFQKKA
jgi:hypothetical protein